jgi:hypothetical protein
MTYGRGAGSNANWGNESVVDQVNQGPSDRGFTVAVTPTADLPAPVAEVTVYGFVKGDVIYAFFDNDFDRSTAWSSVLTDNGDDHISIFANQSRFGIKSKVDTAIGQIRTRIEGDFEGQPYGGNDAFRLRHAYGEWDMTPNLTLIVGQTWRVAALLPLGISTVNFAGSAGWTYSRDPQVKLRYTSGPLTVHLGIEEPLAKTRTNVPVFGGSIQYDIPGGHTVVASAAVGESVDNTGDDHTSWVVQGGFNINLGDVATLTAAAVWGEGTIVGRYTLSPYAFNNGGAGGLADNNEVLGLMAGVSVPVTDTMTFNVVWDYLDAQDGAARGFRNAAGQFGRIHDEMHTVHANVMWQPVKQMRMGWEVMYMWADDTDRRVAAAGVKDNYAQIQWATWFFF